MELINPVKSFKQKQGDKFVIELRFGKLTILEISYDHSLRNFRIELFNVAIVNSKKVEKK
ncbi:MAG: hypothetical protein KAX49_13735 [Halanaerobiales bacterium]|nr:hypothetical protein [Halanaerobiales bacterium]